MFGFFLFLFLLLFGSYALLLQNPSNCYLFLLNTSSKHMYCTRITSQRKTEIHSIGMAMANITGLCSNAQRKKPKHIPNGGSERWSKYALTTYWPPKPPFITSISYFHFLVLLCRSLLHCIRSHRNVHTDWWSARANPKPNKSYIITIITMPTMTRTKKKKKMKTEGWKDRDSGWIRDSGRTY